MSAHVPERPIVAEAQDRFGRAGFARRLANGLLSADGTRARGIVVGLVGPWGSGKSSTLNLIEQELRRRSPVPVVVRFEPWLISGRDDLILALLSDLHSALDKDASTKQKAAKFLDAAAPYLAALGRVSNLYALGAGEVIANGVNAVRERLQGPSGLADLKRSLGKTLRELAVPVVVLIDELDRLLDSEVRTIAQVVRAVMDFPDISYVLAYDQQRVEEALGAEAGGTAAERRARGRAYLEKLVHVPIPLPVAFDEEVRALLRAEVAAVLDENAQPKATFESARGEHLVDLLTKEVLNTPREVLRATGMFRVLVATIGNEVDTIDLLAFSVLHTRFPELSAIMRDAPGRFVPGFGNARDDMNWMAHSELNEEKRWAWRFPGIEIPDAAKTIVAFLLDHEERYPGLELNAFSFRRRRPYLVTLRLGLPPGMTSRMETERFFHLSEEEARRFLVQSRAEGRLPELVDRISEVYPLLPNPSDAFWQPAADLYRRGRSEWMPTFDGLRDTIRDWAALAEIRLKAHSTEGTRFQGIANQLRLSKDPHIAPYWWQQHINAYGLFGHQRQERREAGRFIDESTLREWLIDQARWAKAAFCAGDLLFELRHALVLFQLAYIGEWDGDCSSRMTDLTATSEGIDQLALLLFGGRYATEKSHINLLIDYDTFHERVSQRLGSPSIEAADPQLVAALKRAVGRDL